MRLEKVLPFLHQPLVSLMPVVCSAETNKDLYTDPWRLLEDFPDTPLSYTLFGGTKTERTQVTYALNKISINPTGSTAFPILHVHNSLSDSGDIESVLSQRSKRSLDLSNPSLQNSPPLKFKKLDDTNM